MAGVSSNSSGDGTPNPGLCDGRLTLTTGVPVTTADVTGATTVYFTPYKGSRIALYDGSSTWTEITFSEVSIALGTVTANKPYDVFGYNNGGTLVLEILVWTNDTTRATAMTLVNGVRCKTGATTRRLLGTLYTTSTTATADAEATRYLLNEKHPVAKSARKYTALGNTAMAADSAYRAYQNSAVETQVNWLQSPNNFTMLTSTTCSADNAAGRIFSLGVDSSTAASAAATANGSGNASVMASTVVYVGVPAEGRHYACSVEGGSNVGINSNGANAMLGALTMAAGVAGIVYV